MGTMNLLAKDTYNYCGTEGCGAGEKLMKEYPIQGEWQFAFVTRRPYCPGRPKKLCFTTLSFTPTVLTARLCVVKQSFFGLPGQYGRRVTKANDTNFSTFPDLKEQQQHLPIFTI